MTQKLSRGRRCLHRDKAWCRGHRFRISGCIATRSVCIFPTNYGGGEPFTMPLFFYRDFLPVLEGENHLVVVDRDTAEQPYRRAMTVPNGVNIK